MDEPWGRGEIRNAKDLHAESATFEFPPVLPFPLDNIRISPLKPPWITEEPLGFSAKYIAPGWEYRHVKTLLRGGN